MPKLHNTEDILTQSYIMEEEEKTKKTLLLLVCLLFHRRNISLCGAPSLSTHAAAPVLQLSPAANEAFAIVETHTEDVFTRICQDQKH